MAYDIHPVNARLKRDVVQLPHFDGDEGWRNFRYADLQESLANHDWDLVATDAPSHGVIDVLLDGVLIKNVCAAVSISRGEALCYTHTIENSRIRLNDGGVYIATGKLAVVFDGYAVGNYGPVPLH